MTTVRILVADDHEVVRQGVRSILGGRDGWEICGEAVNGREAVEKAEQLKPDVVVLDMSMPELNGVDATRQILNASPETEVLILTVHESEQLIREILAAGAHGYVLKSDAGRELVAAIESLCEHKPYFTSKVARLVLNGYLHEGKTPERITEPPAGLLTSRERETVQLLAEGKTSKEVAARLGISENTVETHRQHIMKKLDLHSITELVHYAIRNRIIEP